MPYLEINGAQIYYETYGQDQPGQAYTKKAPILLIHGSTITGQRDWSLVAPLLARHWKVIVPDCRGHGHSNNPNLSYSFKEMAGDMAALLGALGYERAHVIGHSNGGNVALVFLMEYPQRVQTAILQAANAYVSPDLVEREPAIFDPQRVASKSPQWMQEMIELHGLTHGEGYWRDLLRLTVEEIIREPNYTPAELASVQRPALIIQGEKDQVNAPARHAQFIARHIPYAESWLPAGAGHNVHQELLFTWVEKVSDFLSRRGDDANEALYRLGRERFADRRFNIFDVQAHSNAQDPARVELSGKVLENGQRQAAFERAHEISAHEKDAQVDAEAVEVLLEQAPWALTNRAAADLRRLPSSLSERLNQALLGDAVRILEEQDDWALVRLEQDGYLGWTPAAALVRCTQAEAQAYRSDCKARIVAELLPGRVNPDLRTPPDGKLPFGVPVPVIEYQASLAQIRLPDGRLWWVPTDGLLPLARCPKPDKDGIAYTLDLMKRFAGIPYLWGGLTPYGFDCSGFAWTFYNFLGVTIPRDADLQFRDGQTVTGDPQPGDLLLFGAREDEEMDERQAGRFARVTHVAISLGDGEFIHSTSANGGVSYNSLNPESPIFRAGLRNSLLGIRRFA